MSGQGHGDMCTNSITSILTENGYHMKAEGETQDAENKK